MQGKYDLDEVLNLFDDTYSAILNDAIKNIENSFLYGDESYEFMSTLECISRWLESEKISAMEIENIDFKPKEESISSLKKQIKNCKNPMQLKELNRKLNNLYRKRKKGKLYETTEYKKY